VISPIECVIMEGFNFGSNYINYIIILICIVYVLETGT